MDTTFKKLRLKILPDKQTNSTPESRYFEKFKVVHEFKHNAPVSSLDFRPNDPHDLGVIAGGKVQLLQYNNSNEYRTFKHYKCKAYGGCFRSDGELFAIGLEDGGVHIFDYKKRNLLRHLIGHQSAVHSVKFSVDNKSVISASDDQTVRLWDISTKDTIIQYKPHTDYIRCVSTYSNSNIFFVGSYDHKISCLDIRQKSPLWSYSLSSPIEDLISDNDNNLYVASGNELILWDIRNNKVIQTLQNHTKAISQVKINSNLLFTNGLDGSIHIYNTNKMSLVHSIHLGTPILSMAISSNHNNIAMGLLNYKLIWKQKETKINKLSDDDDDDSLGFFQTDKPMKLSKSNYLKRGMSSRMIEADVNADNPTKKTKLTIYETNLKKFEYHAALDNVLLTRDPVVIMSVLEELHIREGLKIALQGRSQSELIDLTRFLTKYMSNPYYIQMIRYVINTLVELYSSSGTVDNYFMFFSFLNQISREISYIEQMCVMKGYVKSILALQDK